MTPLSIGSATEIYSDASHCEIIRHWLDHPELADFSRSLRTLVRSLQEAADGDFWRNTLGPLRRLAFAFCSTPLPFAQAAASCCTDWQKIHRQVRVCQQVFPDSFSALENLVQRLEKLSAVNDSPLIKPLEELVRQSTEVSVVIRNPRMNRAVASYFSANEALRNAKVVSAAQLRGAHLCDVLVTLGPCSWFPEYVFSAPRTRAIHVISFRWIRDTWKPGPVLLQNADTKDGKSNNHQIGEMPKVSGGLVPNKDTVSDVLATDLLPPIPIFSITGLHGAASRPDGLAETVPARLCHLSGGRAVFVAADDGATSMVIDTTEPGHTSVRRAPAHELETGLYLLLRTSGGGDFIAPLADRILGALATKRRSEQTEWKERAMSRAVAQFGSIGRRDLCTRISSELNTLTLSEAQPANVHYWLSSKCIRPRKEEDFVAILTFSGLKEKAQELWAAMGEIDCAHRRAGHLIRRMLLQKIADTSLEPLERDGAMVFDLGDQDGGTLSAFQIFDIVAEEIEVATDRIGVLMDSEE